NYIEDFIPSGSGNLLIPNAVVIRENNTVSVSGSGNSSNNNYILKQNYPNPFNPTTIISFSISNSEFTQLKVYNVLGNEVQTLINENKQAGNHQIEFSAENLSNGIYFYRLISGNFSETKKMILLK
ncbi:MAG: T9SS type A sorting domain-containing protein, partial [Ignavibacteriaceae bacterium]|nr:T9SS type A sorting domain-containing protein [Ignavibacteriaceae bacterium]